jgi:hypothetical protein
MDRSIVRLKIEEVAQLDGCELTNKQLADLEELYWRSFETPMPGAWVDQLPANDLDQRVYKMAQLARRIYLRSFLCIGRSRIVKK